MEIMLKCLGLYGLSYVFWLIGLVMGVCENDSEDLKGLNRSLMLTGLGGLIGLLVCCIIMKLLHIQ